MRPTSACLAHRRNCPSAGLWPSWPHAVGLSPTRLRQRRVWLVPAPLSGEWQRMERGQHAWQGPWETRTGVDVSWWWLHVGQWGGGTRAGQPMTRCQHLLLSQLVFLAQPVLLQRWPASRHPPRAVPRGSPPAHMGHSRLWASTHPSPLTQTTPLRTVEKRGIPP